MKNQNINYSIKAFVAILEKNQKCKEGVNIRINFAILRVVGYAKI